MKTSKVLALALVVILLASCQRTYPGPTNSYVSPTPNKTLNAIFATTPTMTVTPLALTKTSTTTFTPTVTPLASLTFTPTVTLTTCTPTIVSANNGCPTATEVAPGNAFNSYTFIEGNVYHLNLSLEGAPTNTEGNLLFKATTTFSVNFDGSAWLYSGIITSSSCQYCDETKGDYVLTLADVPQLTGLIEVLNSPCTTTAGPTTLLVHKLEVQ